MCRENKLDPRNIKGSYAGALGNLSLYLVVIDIMLLILMETMWSIYGTQMKMLLEVLLIILRKMAGKIISL